MAREAGFMLRAESVKGQSDWWECFDEEIKAFEALVRADQREIDAKVCEDGVQNANDWDSSYWDQACENRAAAIRARGNT
jgi:hypothetical protein